MLTLLRCPLRTENKHILRDPELSSVTRNCQIYIMPLDTLKIGIYKLKDFMNCIKVKTNNLLNSIYSSVSPDFRFKEKPTLISLLTRNCRVHCTYAYRTITHRSDESVYFFKTPIVRKYVFE